MDNCIMECGNVTADPKLRYTDAGTPVVAFDIAINRRWTDPATQAQKEKTTFVEVQCWRQLAENVASSIRKGQRVVVIGWLDQNNWQADDGSARSKLRIVGQDVGASMMFGETSFERVDRKAIAATATPAEEAPASPSEAQAAAGETEEPF